MTYAGIGSRDTPSHIQKLMSSFARCIGEFAVLRTGGATGADQAFMHGCGEGQHHAEIFLPWPFYERNAWSSSHREGAFSVHAEPTAAAIALAARHHPAWHRCSSGARKLHARNEHIIRGHSLDDPVEVVICWTLGGTSTGGTGQAIRSAREAKIPVVDLGAASDPRGALIEALKYFRQR